MAAATATATKLSITILIFSSLFLSTFACDHPCLPTLPPKPKPKPRTFPKYPPVNPFCPRDALKLGVCADLLGGLVSLVIGTPNSSPCCTLLQGLVDLDVAACLCTALKANVLGINLNIPISLSLLASACGKEIPDGFKCV